jgi:hypothetical protein
MLCTASASPQVKKLEPMLNCLTPDITYCLRCNTHVTSLLSGTSIKAVVAHISDYISKASLKIYQIFDTVKAVLERNTVTIGGTAKLKENTRVLFMRMVNSLTLKFQIGSPMASMFLLGNPDHYMDHNFKVFWWKAYILKVCESFPKTGTTEGSPEELTVKHGADQNESDDETERVVLMKSNGKYVTATNVDDYVYRSPEFEDTSLYDHFQMTCRLKRTRK